MIDLSGLSILDIYGVGRLPLHGAFSNNELANLLVENWIPYMECHKCGKSDYCKYALPHPHNLHKKQEIRCGVAEAVLRNFLKRSVEIAIPLSSDERQAYLDGAFFLTRFVLQAEQSIGNVANLEFLDWYGDFAPGVFGFMTRIRDTLNSCSQNLSTIPAFKTERGVLFVEGWSEKAFLDALRESHLAWFLDLLVECYDGQGNRRSKRIAMLLEKYGDLGYTIYAQGDADGCNPAIFKGLVDAGTLKAENTFVFAHDFESAVPLPLLLRAMRNIGLKLPFKPSTLRDSLRANPRSVVIALQQDFGVDIDRWKFQLAIELGAMLNHPRFSWWADDKFMQSELGRFLHFTQGIA